ncbi:YDG domain-containing protein, partial [Candidatus Omnitrophota bacterium]
NYDITHANGTLTVTKAPLTVTADDKGKEYGAADPTLTYTPSGTLHYGDAYTVITGVNLSTATGASATAGTHAITASGGTASNYDVTHVTGTLTVTKAPLTVTADDKGKEYGAADPSLTYTPSGTLHYTDAYSVISGVNLSTATGASATAGTHVITASGGTASNYNITHASGTLTVTKAPLTVSSTVAADKIYDGNTAAALSGATLVGVVGGDDVTLGNDTAGTFAQTTVGTGIDVSANMTISGADTGNYTLTQPTGLTADITPKALTVTGTVAANKVYDGNTTAALSGATLVGVIGGDDVALGNDTTGAFAQTTVGPGIDVTTSMTISGTDTGNYTLTQPANLTADITPKGLTVSATGINKIYDDTTTATVILSDDRIGGDVLTVDYTAATFEDKYVGTNKTVYVTGITVTGADAGNYTFNETTTTTADITSAPPEYLRFNIQPTDAPAGAIISPAITVELCDQFDNLCSDDSSTVISIAIDNNPSGATLLGDANVQTINGVSTFSNLCIDTAGTDYTLQASSGSLTANISNVFNIMPAQEIPSLGIPGSYININIANNITTNANSSTDKRLKWFNGEESKRNAATAAEVIEALMLTTKRASNVIVVTNAAYVVFVTFFKLSGESGS